MHVFDGKKLNFILLISLFSSIAHIIGVKTNPHQRRIGIRPEMSKRIATHFNGNSFAQFTIRLRWGYFFQKNVSFKNVRTEQEKQKGDLLGTKTKVWVHFILFEHRSARNKGKILDLCKSDSDSSFLMISGHFQA